MQVLLADAVVNAREAALQQSKGTLCRVRMDVSSNVFLSAVSNRVVSARVFVPNAAIDLKIICHDAGLRVDHFPNRVFQSASTDVRDDLAPNSSLPFDCREDRSFLASASTLADALVSGFPTDIGFIALDCAREIRVIGIGSHRKADAVHEEEGRLVADLAVALNLQSSHAFL